jgi:curved DNA-binding protein CbpA
MRLKDYYKILEVHPSSSQQDIKRAYRQKAIKYHPDKNEGNVVAEEHFKEVQEAYHTLSDPGRRSAYNQKRWLRHSVYREAPPEKITPAIIHKKSHKLRRYVSMLDSSRMNPQALSRYMHHLLSDSTIRILKDWGDDYSNHQIISELLKASTPLSFIEFEKLGEKLILIAGNDQATVENIRLLMKQRKQHGYWSRYQGLFVLVITLLICLFIYFISVD